MEKKHILTSLLVLYIFMILIGTLLPRVGYPLVRNYDKFFHFVEFLILAFLLMKTLFAYKPKNIYAIAIFVSILIIILSEVVQLFVPSRSFSYWDMAFDAMGATIGFILAH